MTRPRGSAGRERCIMGETRREFIVSATAGVVSALPGAGMAAEDSISKWQRETDAVSPETYGSYMRDGDTRGFAALENLEAAFEKVSKEAVNAVVKDVPAVWSVYNMGYVVKTRESLFAIDLVHRRDFELAPMFDFTLITHNHNDHWRPELYRAMNGSRKTVISNFLDNYGTADWRKSGRWFENGGYVRGVRQFRIRDVEIRTSLIDHNEYLIDFTTAFEIRVGNWTMYHTGDSGRGTEPKLGTVWGRPDLWLFFPGCGIDAAAAAGRVRPKKCVFGHMWELSHATGRFTEPLIRKQLVSVREAGCNDVSLAYWGDRIS